MNKFILTPKIQPDKSRLDKLLTQWSDSEDEEHIIDMWNHALKIASPKVIIREAEFDFEENYVTNIGGVKIKSQMMQENFDGLAKVYPYAASCGRELYDWYLSLGDVIEQYIADEISIIYLQEIIGYMYRYVEENIITDGKLAAMNPGSIETWPLSGQRDLFAILETAESDAGITLTDSCLMLPHKASSGILFSSAKEYSNCMYCPRITCPNRRDEFVGAAL